TAWRVAQALVCSAGDPLGCGQCSACQRAVELSDEAPAVPLHPDVLLVQRGLYPPALLGGKSEATGISVEQIRSILLSRLGFPPHEGRALVFIVRDADELTTQAANALLKTLEEPPQRTHFVLLTSRPHRLLDTIRSRTLPVRFGPLPEAVLERILRERGLEPSVAAIAEGSAELALTLASPDSVREREEFVSAAEAALAAPDLAPALRFAETQKGDRDTIKQRLAFFAHALAARARDGVRDGAPGAKRWAERHAQAVAAIADLEHNVQPALALESMLIRMRSL